MASPADLIPDAAAARDLADAVSDITARLADIASANATTLRQLHGNRRLLLRATPADEPVRCPDRRYFNLQAGYSRAHQATLTAAARVDATGQHSEPPSTTPRRSSPRTPSRSRVHACGQRARQAAEQAARRLTSCPATMPVPFRTHRICSDRQERIDSTPVAAATCPYDRHQVAPHRCPPGAAATSCTVNEDRHAADVHQRLHHLPSTVDLMTAARALGLGRTLAYDLARRGQFPCRILKIGDMYRVPTAELLRLLGMSPTDPGSPRAAA